MEGISELIGSDGTFGDGFADAMKGALGAGYEDTKYFDDVPNIVALAKRGIDSRAKNTELSEAVKQKGLIAPGENATDEEKSAFQTQLRVLSGATDNVDDYICGAPDNLPEGLTFDPAHERKWAEALCAAGVPVEAAKTLIREGQKEAIEAHNAAITAERTRFDTSVKELREKYQPDDLKVLGVLACDYFEKKGSQDKIVDGQTVKGMKTLVAESGIRQTPDDFEKWLSLGIDPDQVIMLADHAKDFQAGSNRLGTGAQQTDADASFINSVNAKSPGMQVPA